MPIGGQSLGKDCRIVLVLPNGGTLNIPSAAITKFKPTPQVTDEKRKGLDGEARHNVIHDGWKVDIELDRFDSTVDDFWAAAEDAYYTGVNLGWGYMQETIQEPNGGTSQYRYEKVAYKVTDLGDREGDKVIKMKMEALASRRRKTQ